MKDNILNNTKNVQNNDIIYKSDGQMSQLVKELYNYSRDGNFDKLKQLIEKNEFQGSTLNIALRNLIASININNSNYLECFKLLLSTNIDLNYKFPKDNSTILMNLSSMLEFELIKELLDAQSKSVNQENNKFQTIEEEEKYEIEQKKIFFSQKDSNNNNFFNYFFHHYEINKSAILMIFKYIYEVYPFENNRKEEISKKIKEIFDSLLIETNNDGDNFMNLSLINKCPQLVLLLIDYNCFVPNIINKKKENYIHSAVRGNNFICLKIMLYHCNINDLVSKNIDNLTPAELAYKLGFTTISNIITEYQNNFNEEAYKDNFRLDIENFSKKNIEDCNYNDNSDFSIDLLINFIKGKFRKLLCELNMLKIINYLSIEDPNTKDDKEEACYKILYAKIEWNIIMIKMKLNQIEYEKDDEINANNNIISNNNNNKIKYNKKKSKKIEEKNKNTIFPFLKSILEIQENLLSNKIISTFIDITKSNYLINPNENIDILIYNKIIFYFKIGNYKYLINMAEIYLTKIYLENKNIRSLILYINITCILIETFIYQGYSSIAEIIVKALDEYLDNQNLIFRDLIYTLDDKIIFDYLNKREVLTPFLSDWEILFNYSNFLKLLINKGKSNEIIEDLRKKCIQSKKDLSILKRFNILLKCIEIKKLYEKEDDKIYNKISDLQNMGIDSEIYYCNIVGIIFLKMKKYNLSKSFFQKGLNKYIQIIKNRNIKNNNSDEENIDVEKFVNFRIDYITAFLYNINLCHFYLGEYNKCIEILEKLLIFQNNKNNIFFYYRLGICYLQLYIVSNKNTSDYFNNNILKLIGYEENNISNKKHKSDKPLSIDLDNSSNGNISFQLDSDFNKEMEDNKFNNIYNDKKINYYNYKNNTIDIDNYSHIKNKKIILKNSTKFIYNKKNINNNLFNNDNIQMNSNNQNENKKMVLLQKAIKSFKKILIISKSNLYTNSTKSLYNFYKSNLKKENLTEKDNLNNHKRKKIPNEIIINTYLNLLFCLSLKNNWLEMIFIIKDYYNKKISSNRIVSLKILLFKLEAYVNLNNSSKIKEIIQKLKSYKNIEFSAFNKTDNDIINNINIKLYLYYTIILIYIKEKKYKEMDIYTDKMLSLVKNEKNIPYYIIDLLLNVFLIKLNNEPNINKKNKFINNKIILNLIKNKKTIKAD